MSGEPYNADSVLTDTYDSVRHSNRMDTALDDMFNDTSNIHLVVGSSFTQTIDVYTEFGKTCKNIALTEFSQDVVISLSKDGTTFKGAYKVYADCEAYIDAVNVKKIKIVGTLDTTGRINYSG